MPQPVSMHDRRRDFAGGSRHRGPAGLEKLSVSCEMSSDDPEAFRARVVTTALGRAMITRTKAAHLTARRRPSLLDDGYSDFVQIGFVLSGVSQIEQGRSTRRSGAGQLSVLNLAEPFVARMRDPNEVVQFYLPADLLRAHRIPVRSLSGSWPSGPIARATRAFVSDIATAEADLNRAETVLSGEALLQLGLSLAYELRSMAQPMSDVREAARIRALAFLRSNFRNSNLAVDDVARQLGCSRGYLQGLFSGTGGGVATMLRRMRLDEAKRLLADTDLSVARIAAAAGFAGPTQFSRTFKRELGMTPRDHRALSTSPNVLPLFPDGDARDEILA